MKRLSKTSIPLLMLLLVMPFTGFTQETKTDEYLVEKDAALLRAKAWLDLVDKGQYAHSWDAASTFFEMSVSEDDWKKSLESVRTPLGKLISREVIAQQYMTKLPGAPDGEYVVFQFKSSFENKQEAVETVTPYNENGNWKVSGYYIK